MSTAGNLIDILSPIRAASGWARVYNGDVQAFGAGFFIQTKSMLPNMYLSVGDVARVVTWLGTLAPGESVRAEVTAHRTVFNAEESSISIRNADSESLQKAFENVGEVVLKPTLTNDYSLTTSVGNFYNKVTGMLVVVGENNLFDTVVTVSTEPDKILFAVEGVHGSAKYSLPADEGAPWLSNWQGRFLLKPLQMRPVPTIPAPLTHNGVMLAMHQSPNAVTISFAANTNKALSPLMLQYTGGVTVVLSPLYY